jgi:hypothetical protein
MGMHFNISSGTALRRALTFSYMEKGSVIPKCRRSETIATQFTGYAHQVNKEIDIRPAGILPPTET